MTWSSDPESHPKVGFESVSGFGFPVSSIETNFRCRFRVSGFGFRRLKPIFAVGFGFQVSGFGFRSALGKLSLRFRVSGFGFRSVLGNRKNPQLHKGLQSRFRISGFGFRSVLGISLQSRFRVSGFAVETNFITVGFRFRVSGFAGRNQLCRPLSGPFQIAEHLGKNVKHGDTVLFGSGPWSVNGSRNRSSDASYLR